MEGIRTASRLEGETHALSERIRTGSSRRSSAAASALRSSASAAATVHGDRGTDQRGRFWRLGQAQTFPSLAQAASPLSSPSRYAGSLGPQLDGSRERGATVGSDAQRERSASQHSPRSARALGGGGLSAASSVISASPRPLYRCEPPSAPESAAQSPLARSPANSRSSRGLSMASPARHDTLRLPDSRSQAYGADSGAERAPLSPRPAGTDSTEDEHAHADVRAPLSARSAGRRARSELENAGEATAPSSARRGGPASFSAWLHGAALDASEADSALAQQPLTDPAERPREHEGELPTSVDVEYSPNASVFDDDEE